jgi:uncharacterized lipoprotein YmbA
MRSRGRLRVWLPLLCAASLTACASPAPVTLPTALRTCQPEPAPPGPEADDVTFAAWVAEVLFAGRDCRDALARVVEMIDR